MLDPRNTALARLEFAQKTAEDLVLGTFAPETRFTITAISAGYIREVLRGTATTLGVGLQATVNLVPSALEPFYGSRTPLGGMVFIRLRPLHGPHSALGMAMPMHH